MTPPRRFRPLMLVVSAGVLLVSGLWLVPGTNGILGGGGDGGKESCGEVRRGEGKGDEPGAMGTRVRERPPEPSKTQRQLRNLLAEKLGMMGPPPHRIDMEKLKGFREVLDGMSAEDLLAVLAELDASEIGQRDKWTLAGFIVGSLSRRDPKLALDIAVPRLAGGPPGPMVQLGMIYSRWAATDLAAAAAWFDQQVAKGALAVVAATGDVKIDPRSCFELKLIQAQAAMNPEAAETRFAALSADAKEKILADEWFNGTSAELIKAQAEFLRSHYNDGPATLAKAGSMRIRQGDLGDAEKFLDVLEPDQDERAALVGEALRVRVTGRDELMISPEEAREWIVKQSPEEAEGLTGAMLGQMVQWHKFAEMSRLALQYREESGSDEVLVAFLKSAPVKAKEEILKMAEEIEDAVVRAEVTGRFGN